MDGLLPTDFTVKENGVEQKLSFFTADPFGLSVAIVLDLGMPDAEVQKVNQTFSALVGAFAPYDEVALYTYSSTVSQVSDFAGATREADRAVESDEDRTRAQQWRTGTERPAGAERTDHQRNSGGQRDRAGVYAAERVACSE